jgi:hypothetical protein
MSGGARKWILTLVTGLIVGVTGGALRPQLPGLSGVSVISGQVIINEGYGNILLLDPLGRIPTQRIALPPRLRDQKQRRLLESSIERIAVDHVWWDSRKNVFDAVSTLTSLTGQPLVIDSAISQYYGDGSPRGEILTSTIEALSYIVTSPVDDRRLIVGDTLQGDGARIGILNPDGHQLVITHDSSQPVSWSADGSRLAYGCYVQHGSPQLCIYDLAARKQRVYTLVGIKNIMNPTFSPDASSVALIVNVGNSLSTDLVVVQLSDGHSVTLTADARQKGSPQWSPSGRAIMYITPDSVVFHLIATGQETTVPEPGGIESVQWVSSSRSAFGHS